MRQVRAHYEVFRRLWMSGILICQQSSFTRFMPTRDPWDPRMRTLRRMPFVFSLFLLAGMFVLPSSVHRFGMTHFAMARALYKSKDSVQPISHSYSDLLHHTRTRVLTPQSYLLLRR